MELAELLSGEGRSEGSIRQYISLLNRLHKRTTGSAVMENLLWLHDVEAVTRALDGYKPASKKLYIIPILILLRKGQHHELATKYYEHFKQAMHELSQERKGSLPGEKVVTTGVSIEAVHAKRRELLRQIKGLGADAGNQRPLLMQYLILTLYTGISSLPSDLSRVRVVRLGERIEGDTIDHLVEERIEKFSLLPRRKKAAGTGKIQLAPSVNKAVSESLKLFPRKFLLSSQDGKSHMSAGELRRPFSSLFLSEGTVMDLSAILQIFASNEA